MPAKENVEIGVRSASFSAMLRQAGATDLLDVQRSAAAVASARATLAPLEGERKAALFSLADLRGRSPAEFPGSVTGCLSITRLKSSIQIGDGASLLRRRPNVACTERILAAENAMIGVATADLSPEMRFGETVSHVGWVGAPSGLSFGRGPLLSFSFPKSIARARVSQAEARTLVALSRLNSVLLAVLREVEQTIEGGPARPFASYSAPLRHCSCACSRCRKAPPPMRNLSWLRPIKLWQQLKSLFSRHSEAVGLTRPMHSL
jgi:outer membrane protein TolC